MSLGAKLSVPLSVSVTCLVVARCRADRNGVVSGEGDDTTLVHVEAAGEEDGDVCGRGDSTTLVDGESAGEDVAEVGGVLGADGIEREGLAVCDGVVLDLDALEAEVVVAGSGEVLHVDGGDVERRVEAVADQVAGVEDDTIGQVDLAEGEGTAAGLEMPAGVDDDLGVVAAVGVVGIGGAEGGGCGLEQAAATDDDLRRSSSRCH